MHQMEVYRSKIELEPDRGFQVAYIRSQTDHQWHIHRQDVHLPSFDRGELDEYLMEA